jgi:hypothetical protein
VFEYEFCLINICKVLDAKDFIERGIGLFASTLSQNEDWVTGLSENVDAEFRPFKRLLA